MGTSALFFKPSEVHPCPGPELWERERDTELWGQKEQDAEKENKTENGGVGSCKSATFFSLLISRRAYYLPRDRQTCSSKAYSGNDQCCRSSWVSGTRTTSSEVPENSHSYFFFLPPRWYNAGYESQAVKSEVQKVQTLRLDVKPGEDTDEMNACLTETWGSGSMRTHSGGGFFFVQSAGLLASVTLMPSAAHALAYMIPPTH